MCIPYFDSPSIFARILDKDKGGHFSITPTFDFKTKQQYMPNSNVLATKFLNEDGIGLLTGEYGMLCRSGSKAHNTGFVARTGAD